MTDDTRPLLLLDVDGPLNPYDGRKSLPEGFVKHRASPYGEGRTSYDVYLNPAMGPKLLEFAAAHNVELAWATTWEHAANEWIGPHIGLPELPVVEFGFNGHSWKFGGVCAFAKGRPLAWLDDDFHEFQDLRVKYFDNARKGIPSLLHHVDPSIGITDADLAEVGQWFESLAALSEELTN